MTAFCDEQPPDGMSMVEYKLGIVQMAITKVFTDEAVRSLTVHQARSWGEAWGQHVMHVTMAAPGMDSNVISCPADWWQHFKQRWFPDWAINRWPVRMEHRYWRAYFPKDPTVVEDRLGQMCLRVEERRSIHLDEAQRPEPGE